MNICSLRDISCTKHHNFFSTKQQNTFNFNIVDHLHLYNVIKGTIENSMYYDTKHLLCYNTF